VTHFVCAENVLWWASGRRRVVRGSCPLDGSRTGEAHALFITCLQKNASKHSRSAHQISNKYLNPIYGRPTSIDWVVETDKSKKEQPHRGWYRTEKVPERMGVATPLMHLHQPVRGRAPSPQRGRGNV